jgi:Fe-S-cluster formation regulator IscX/YfhJ
MDFMIKVIAFLLFSIFFFSCSKENIDPAFAPQNYVQRVVIDYPIRNVEVDRVGNDIGDVPVVGGVFQRLAEALADITIETDSGVDGMEVPIEPQVFNLTELNEVDFSYVDSVNLHSVRLRVAEALDDLSTDENEGPKGLNFVNKIQVIMELDSIPDNINEVAYGNESNSIAIPNDTDDTISENLVDIYADHLDQIDEISDTDSRGEDQLNERDNQTLQKESEILVLSYDKKLARDSCSGDCIDMKVHNHNWKAILQTNRKFKIKVKLFIETVPKESLRLDGNIRFSFVVNAGF